MKKITVIALLLAAALGAQARNGSGKPAYKDASRPVEERVSDLLSRMTLEEKVMQLNQYTLGRNDNANNMADPVNDIPAEIGSLIYYGSSPELRNRVQRKAVEESRLGIPLLIGLDVIHGYKTVFPIPLAISCSWNPELIRKSARIAAEEASAFGINWFYSPMVDIARDARWGRIAEGSGEDPWWGSEIAKAMVKGYQGDDLSAPNTVMACVKHYALYGASEAGRDYNTVDMSRVAMYNYYLPPYKAAAEAGAGSFMSSFNVVDGIPATGNRWLLTDVLRDQWKFDGFVVSDAGSVGEMTAHGMGDLQQVAALALKAGLDMDMGANAFIWTLKKSLDEGKVTRQEIDQACRRILEAKYKLGLFDNPYQYTDPERQKKALSPEYLQTARELAGESIVLLKNDRQILPLQKTGKIAVIGPMGNTRGELFGTWVMLREEAPARSIFEAVKEVVGDRAEVVYAQGSNLTEEPMLLAQTGKNTTPTETLIEQALETAKDADVIVATVGEPSGWSGEARSRSDIGLPECQKALLKALHDTGKPVVVAIMSGRPLTLSWENERFDAILEAWHGGTMAGYALADVLFGDRVPSGKLTATFPQSVGQLPLYYNSLNTGRPYRADFWATTKYLDITNDPVYPFGYGLSYTTFDYSDIQLDRAVASGGSGTINATVKVTNTGTRTGDEIVQLYIGDPVASISRPVRELKNFRRITLKPGETQGVTFRITTADLKFYNSVLEHVWEPGEFNVCIGPNSRDVKTAKINWTK